MLLHRDNEACLAKGFYTYDAFIAATRKFPDFAMTGTVENMKREIADFFAQISHETTRDWPNAPDGPYAWGYCCKEENRGGDYCEAKEEWPCVPGKQYYGRGPIQLSYGRSFRVGSSSWNISGKFLTLTQLVI